MRRVRDAPAEHSRFEFIEFLNLLEAFALLHNEKKIAPTTKRITCKFLIEALAWIKGDDAIRQLMKDSVTADDTFTELYRFEGQHQREITKHAKRYAIKKGVR